MEEFGHPRRQFREAVGSLRSVRCMKLLGTVLTVVSLSLAACGNDEPSGSVAATTTASSPAGPSSSDPTTSSSPATNTATVPASTATRTSTPPPASTAPRPKIVASNCTAASTPAPPPTQAGLTDAAATTRSKVIDAARQCLISELAAVATSGPEPFRFSFGADPGDPTEVWLGSGFDPAVLLRLFALDVKHRVYRDTQSGAILAEYFIWPGAAFEPTDHDWQAAESLYPASELARMKEIMGGYTGIRAFITPAGHWSALVEGD